MCRAVASGTALRSKTVQRTRRSLGCAARPSDPASPGYAVVLYFVISRHAPCMEAAPRKLAILFADVSGSTKLYETLGDAEALQTIGRCLDIMRKVCEEHGGRIVKTIGDEAMAVFPLPANAAYASISMHTQISSQRTSKGAALAIHAGFHFGPIIDENADVFGDSVNVPARLSSLAKARQT